MTTGDILLIIIMFSGSIVFCCVTNYMCCSEDDFTMRPAEPLQNKETAGVVDKAIVIQEI
jgi:hypothetical protein